MDPYVISSPLLRRPLILLVYLPVFNWLFFSLALVNTQLFTWELAFRLALLLWLATAFCLASLVIVEKYVSPSRDSSRYFIAKYSAGAILGGWIAYEILAIFSLNDHAHREAPIVPVMVALLEVTLLAAMRHILAQNQRQLLLESNYKAARYTALKAQLNPHFLFNTLNLISSEIDHDPAKAIQIVDEFSELLRAVLNSSTKPTIPLTQEIELVRHYLSIQQMRFSHRFEYVINVEPGCKDECIPALILQPLVENSIVHGFADRKESGLIRINISKLNNRLNIQINDNGGGFNEQHCLRGHGLSIVNDTLKLLYADQARFNIDLSIDRGTSITLEIPINLNVGTI